MRKISLTIVVALMMMVSGLATSAPSAAATNGLPAPEKVRISAETRPSDGKPVVFVSWRSVPQADGYNIYRNGRYIDTVRGSRKSGYTDAGVDLKTYSKRYTYNVVSFRDSPRAFTNGTPTTQYLRAPKPTQATMYEAVISNNKVLVLFWPSRDAAGYNVYRDGRFLKSIDGDETYFRDVPPRGNHTYTMIAYGYKGNYFVKAKGSSSINY